MYQQPVTTALVELAGDGQTAKGLWYSIGQRTTSRPDGTAEALWVTTKIGIDFILKIKTWLSQERSVSVRISHFGASPGTLQAANSGILISQSCCLYPDIDSRTGRLSGCLE